jgi:hypothetical protein
VLTNGVGRRSEPRAACRLVTVLLVTVLSLVQPAARAASLDNIRGMSVAPNRPEYFSQNLTPYPLPTKDGGVLRTIGNVQTYILTLPKKRGMRAHWKHACRLLLQEVGAAAVTRQVHLALSRDSKLDIKALQDITSARRWLGAHKLED